MSFIKEKRQKLATALERARHSSSSSTSSTSSSINEFNTSLSCISLDNLEAFSDPFSCEISECGSLFENGSFQDSFYPTEWPSSPCPSAISSLPSTLDGTLDLCEWDLEHHQLDQHDQWPLQKCQLDDNSLDLFCGTDDFLATAEDTLDVLSRIVYNDNIEETEADLIDMIDNRQSSSMERTPDNCAFESTSIFSESTYTKFFSDARDDGTFHIVPTRSKSEIPPNSVLKKDTWLFDKSSDDLKHAPQQLVLTSPNSTCRRDPRPCIIMKESKITQYTTYVSNTPPSFKREIGVAINTDVSHEQGHKKRHKKRTDLTPEDLLIKREKNRLRSKAYREKRKLQLKTLQEEVILARLEADIAKKQAKMEAKESRRK